MMNSCASTLPFTSLVHRLHIGTAVRIHSCLNITQELHLLSRSWQKPMLSIPRPSTICALAVFIDLRNNFLDRLWVFAKSAIIIFSSSMPVRATMASAFSNSFFNQKLLIRGISMNNRCLREVVSHNSSHLASISAR